MSAADVIFLFNLFEFVPHKTAADLAAPLPNSTSLVAGRPHEHPRALKQGEWPPAGARPFAAEQTFDGRHCRDSGGPPLAKYQNSTTSSLGGRRQRRQVDAAAASHLLSNGMII
jgi:hypothetical protein